MTEDTPYKDGKRNCASGLMRLSSPHGSPFAFKYAATPISEQPRWLLAYSGASLRSVTSTSTMVSKEDDTSEQQSHTITSPPTASINETLPARKSRPSLSTLLAFIALNLAIFLVALDTVLIPTALPTIALSFHVPDALYAWIGSAYLLANASSVPLWGKLSDIFGRKPIIITANCVFLAGSIVCAISANAATLVAGRAVQGLGGGGVVVLVHVCVSDLFDIR
jgi:Na+/melibiose symporter-like transporter